jgi:Fur-regulated basic protein B
VDVVKKLQLRFEELVKKNKEELLADQKRIEIIEKRLDDKYTNPKK